MNETSQPCGHPWGAVVWLDEETCDCGACLEELEIAYETRRMLDLPRAEQVEADLDVLADNLEGERHHAD